MQYDLMLSCKPDRALSQFFHDRQGPRRARKKCQYYMYLDR